MVAVSVLSSLVYAAACGPFPPLVGLDAALAAEAVVDRGPAYTVKTHRQSYFQLNESGGLVEQDGLPIRAEKIYHLRRTIDPDTAAIVVMDPWIDMASDHLNQYYGRIAESHVVPLVNKGLERGHRIIVLTNDPAVVKYNTRIHPKLAALVADKRATLLYHQNFDDDQFADYLHKAGISTLIYTGFASNMCVIGRRMGMIPMVQQGFKTYFVPEASAAVEMEGTWESGSVHRETTNIISQWIAEIVHYDEFMQAGSTE
ncbi:MAG TPA: isochorismatase family protein [Planctomycetaceae bacterium]|nr:isochorismatase family protein [Planctomycetaceae bacterium]